METELPSQSDELVQAALKASVSVIPVFGGLIAELGNCLVNPVEERKREWARNLEKALQVLKLQYKKLPQTLAEEPAFLTALFKATGIALATHRKEKQALLREFLIAVGSRAIPDEELQNALLKLLDDFTVGHLDILRFLESGHALIEGMETLETVYGHYRQEYKGALGRTTFRWIIADLSARMVIHLGDMEDMNEFASQRISLAPEDSGIRPLQITDLGGQLLALLRGNAGWPTISPHVSQEG